MGWYAESLTSGSPVSFDILLLYLRLTQKSFAVDILFFFSLFLALFLEGLVEAFL